MSDMQGRGADPGVVINILKDQIGTQAVELAAAKAIISDLERENSTLKLQLSQDTERLDNAGISAG